MPLPRTPAPAALLALAALANARASTAQAPRPSPADAAPAAMHRDAAMTDAELSRRARVLARVGDEAVTVGELEDMLNEAPAPVRAAYVDPARRREFLDNVLQTMLLASEARRRGLDRTPETASALRRILAQRLEQAAVLEAITPEQITDAEVRAYFDAHVSDYQQPEFRRATAVFTDDRAAGDAAATQARAARGNMRAIQQLAREHSVDTASRAHDGDLFYFDHTGRLNGAPGSVDPAVATAAFTLTREMDVAGPVQTAGGKWAVVVLTGVRPALLRAATDQAVVNAIRGALVRERRTARQRALIAELRERLHPEVHEDRVDRVVLPQLDLGAVGAFDPGAPPRRTDAPGHSPVPPPASAAAPAPAPAPAPHEH